MSCNLGANLPQCLGFPLGVYNEVTGESDYSFEAGLTYYLKHNPKIACLIGDNVFPYYVPKHAEQAGYPCITYNITDVPVDGVTGQSGIATATIELDCWATTFDDSVKVAEACRRAIQGFSGWFGPVAVVGAWYQGYDDEAQQPADNSAVYWFGRTVTIDVSYLVPLHTF